MAQPGEISERGYKLGWDQGYEKGLEEGERKALQKYLSWLEEKYLGGKAPERGTPEAQAILTLARAMSRFAREN